MSYKPSIVEIFSKSFAYCVLAIGGMIGTLAIAVMILGGRNTGGEGQKFIAVNLWELVNTPYFAAFTFVVLIIAIYSSIKGYVPNWAKYTAYTLVGIALAPITALYLLDLLAIKLGYKIHPNEQLKPDITPSQRIKASSDKNT